MTCKINLSMFLSFSVQLKSKTVVKKTFSKCSQIVSIVIVALLAGHILTLRFSRSNFNISKMHACKNNFTSLISSSAILGFLITCRISDLLGFYVLYILSLTCTREKNEMLLSFYQYFSLITSVHVLHLYFFSKDKNMFLKKENYEQG